ncbi:MAG TPA: M14 family zinc carboxypeptidase [Solirubrobacteraceae bacterium]|jgi:hypothetical protein
MPLAPRLALATLLAVLATAAPAAAATTLPGVPTVAGAAQAVDRACDQKLLAEGAAGAQTLPYTMSRAGALTVRTDAPSGDWDLALFDAATRRLLAASATFGAREMATAYLPAGRRVAIQACRRSGATSVLNLGLDFYAIPAQLLKAGRGERASLVSVSVASREDVERLEALGLDVTHSTTGRTVDVVLYGAADRARLTGAGFLFTTKVADMRAQDRQARAAELRTTRRRPRTAAAPEALKRTTYRTYADYGDDLHALVDAHPGLVKPVVLPTRSLENRPIEGVEIAENAGQPSDGRPIFLLGGLTHAREWPGGELAIEFAIDMANSYGTDPAVTELLKRVRIVVLPMLNPDGYVVSREAGTASGNDSGDDSPEEATLPFALNDAAAYKRKNCRPGDPDDPRPCALRSPFGVDLNRAYGAYWGGPGTSDDNTTQQYRGTAPFSEPEAIAVRQFGASHQIQTFITNHTFTDGRILRQPGFQIPNDEVGDVTPDEAIFKRLGDAMADSTGYISELGYATLGNITGPSDDHLYYSQGTIGYTPEMRGGNFHTGYADAVLGEYAGEGDKAGRGWREAYMRAAQQAADPADHAVIRGTAPAGQLLRLRKTTQLHTSDDEDGDGEKDKEAMVFDEAFDTTLTVPPSGAYEWHVNPSTRPLAPAPEAFTMTCETPQGIVIDTTTVVVGRGEAAVRDFACSLKGDPGQPGTGGTDGTNGTNGSNGTNGTDGTAGQNGQNGTAGQNGQNGAPGQNGQNDQDGTSPAKRPRVLIRRPTSSARHTRRHRGLAVYLNLRDIELRGVRVRLVDRRGRTIAAGTRKRLESSGRVTLKLRRTPRTGRHRVIVTARDAAGNKVRVTRRVRVKR